MSKSFYGFQLRSMKMARLGTCYLFPHLALFQTEYIVLKSISTVRASEEAHIYSM